MTSVMQRQRSRRQLAALTFLSNISLDGTHNDTKLSSYKCGHAFRKNLPTAKTDGKENLSAASLAKIGEDNFKDFSSESKNTTCLLKKEVRLGEEFLVQSQPSCKEKDSATETSDRPGLLKKLNIQVAPISERLCFSSSESLVGSLPGKSGRTRKSSSSWSEASMPPPREIRFMKFTHCHQIKEERVVLVSANKTPWHIFSSIPFNKQRIESTSKELGRRRHVSGARPLSTISDSTDPAHLLGLVCFEEALEASYSDLLVPSRNFFCKSRRQPPVLMDYAESSAPHTGIARCFSYEPATHKATAHYLPHYTHSCQDYGATFSQMTSATYLPNVVDDPELRAGKHRKLLRFASYMTSVIDYTKPSELKKELNDKFKEKFPNIQLTLSKLRSLKREMVKIARHECAIDLLTVAQAYVYFEKLLLQITVNKQNRKLVAGACLILSAKMNDVKGDCLSNLIAKTENVFRLNRRELLQWEFASLVALEFGLHAPLWQIHPHYQRLLYES